MAIPNSQLETWSHQGAGVGSRDTYAGVKRALEAPDSQYAGKAFEVFLQGSYGNDTNIWAESDVDVVMELTGVYYYDLSALPPNQQAEFKANHGAANYNFDAFRTDVLAVLRASFGADVRPGLKAIAIQAD